MQIGLILFIGVVMSFGLIVQIVQTYVFNFFMHLRDSTIYTFRRLENSFIKLYPNINLPQQMFEKTSGKDPN